MIGSDNLAAIKVAEKIVMTFECEGNNDQGPFLLYSRSKPFAGGNA